MSVLTTNQKGAIAETALAKAALEVGYDVYRPMFEGGRYDLIFDTGEKMLRVQCKWAPDHDGVINVRSYSSRRAADGFRRTVYSEDEIDAIVAYCPENQRCYYVPAAKVTGRFGFNCALRRRETIKPTG